MSVTAGEVTGVSSGTDDIANINDIVGTDYNDIFTADTDGMVFRGGTGADTFTGGSAADIFHGGDDADLFIVNNDNSGDQFNGDGGLDVLDASSLAGYITVDLTQIIADQRIENVGDTMGNDAITGIEGFIGTAGNDSFIGITGEDNYFDGNGGAADVVDYSGISGVASGIIVTLNGSTDASVSINGSADDTIKNIENVIGSNFADTIIGDSAANVLTGNGGDDVLDGGAGLDTIDGGAGDDIIEVSTNDGVIDIIDGGANIDTIDYSDLAQSIVVDLDGSNAVDASIGGSVGDNIVNIENVTGSSVADILTGDTLTNILRGMAGNDTLDGDGGNDTLYGGDDNDTLDGGAGDDALFGEAGDDLFLGSIGTDTYDGGVGGSDTIDFSGVAGDINLDLTNETATKVGDSNNQDNFTEIENLILGAGADAFVMDADDLANFTAIDGGAGLDTLSFNTTSMDLDTFGGDGFDGADLAAVFSDIEELDFTNISSTGGSFSLSGEELKGILGDDNADNLTIQMDSGTGFSFDGSGLTLSGTVGNTTTYTYDDGGTIYTVDVIDNV